MFIALLMAFSTTLVQAPTAPSVPAMPEITVYGRIMRDAPRLVQRFGHATSGDRLARWREPICVAVEGLDSQHDQWISARMSDIAENVGAPVGPGACTPNIIVVIANPDAPLRKRIEQGAYRFLNASTKPIDRAQLAAFTQADGAPAHLYYATGTAASATGTTLVAGYTESTELGFGVQVGAPVVHANASRLVPAVEPSMARVVLVLDGKRTAGKSLQQIAAYAALTTLAEVRTEPPQTDPASIVALFTDAAPSDLTVWDYAYLRGLYGGDAQINLSMQQSVLADQLKQVITAAHQAQTPSARP